MKILEIDVPRERRFSLHLPVTSRFLGVEAFRPKTVGEGHVYMYVACYPKAKRRMYDFVCVVVGRTVRESIHMEKIGMFASPTSGRAFFLFVKNP